MSVASSYSLLKLVFIFTLGTIVIGCDSKPKGPSDEKLLMDFDEVFKEQFNKKKAFTRLDLKAFRSVFTLSTEKIIEKERIAEDRLRAAYLVRFNVDMNKVNQIIKQRKQSRNFFGTIGRQYDDRKDQVIRSQLNQLNEYSIFTLDFIETSRDFWKANIDTLKESTVARHKEILHVENSRLEKELQEIATKERQEKAEKERQVQLEIKRKAETVKSWIEADKKPWLTEKELLKISPTHYHTGNRCRADSMNIKKKVRLCEDVVLYVGDIHMKCGKKGRKENTPYNFFFRKAEGKWVSYPRMISSLDVDKKKEKEKLQEQFNLLKNKGKCTDGSNIITTEIKLNSDEMNARVYEYLKNNNKLQ